MTFFLKLHVRRKPLMHMSAPRTILLILVLAQPLRLFGSGMVKINELMASNVHFMMLPDHSDFADWIELYNDGDVPAELGDFYLSDDFSDPFKWRLPAGLTIDAKSFVVLWANGSDPESYPTFQLSWDGEQVGLFDGEGNVIDTVTFGRQADDVSMGRFPDGGDTWYYYPEPTPGDRNITPGLASDLRAPRPSFSLAGGLYSGPQAVSLAAAAGSAIYYTLDGSLPTRESFLYSEPIVLTGTSVIRARVYHDQMLPGEVVTHTYIIDEPATLAVISLATNPEYLFDGEIGITAGVCVSDAHDAPPPFDFSANYWKEWERPVHIEYYTADGHTGFRQDAGIAIFGGFFGRQIRQKSFTLYARDRYGDQDFDFPLFPAKPMNSYKRFLLRASSNDFNRTFIRDAMMNSLVIGQMDVDYQAYQPALVYINGDFWGLYNIREKTNHFYPESNYGISSDSVDLVEGIDRPAHGDISHYLDMIQYARENDMTQDVHYTYMKTRMDVTEFMNYYITELYVNNKDWIHQNIKCWREHAEGSRWRWILYDMDWGFSNQMHWMFEEYRDPSISWILDAMPEAELFHRLIQNDAFRTEFVQRFVSHLNLTFRPERVHRIIDGISEGISSEMPRQIERWGAIPDLAYWNEQLQILHDFAENRPLYLLPNLDERLMQGEKETLITEVSPEGAGWVSVFEAPCPEPVFSGHWYRDVPLLIKAHAKPGWKFVRWEGSYPSEAESQNITLDGPAIVHAVFEPLELPWIVVSEIHYNPSSELQGTDEEFEFMELVNWGTEPEEISGFHFTDGIDFTFPQGTLVNPGEYLILASHAATYANTDAKVFQITGGRLDNAGEKVTLADPEGHIVDEVLFDDHYPWPREPDGEGPSLELKHPSLDNSLAGSWKASEQSGGTPGAGSSNVFADGSNPWQPGSLQIWPNPFSEVIHIRYTARTGDRISATLLNMFGQVVRASEGIPGEPGDHVIGISTAGLPAGVYFIRVSCGPDLQLKKVIHTE